jgi:hypothetical protein
MIMYGVSGSVGGTSIGAPSAAARIAASQATSRASSQATSIPSIRLTTRTCSIVGDAAAAASAASLSRTTLPRRVKPLAVTRTRAPASWSRAAIAALP